MQVWSGENRQIEAQGKRQKGIVRPLPDDGLLNLQKTTDELARLVMGWRTAPDRFIKSGRSWIPRWRFQPFTELADAFQLLDQAASQYTLSYDGRTFTADVLTATGRGIASGEQKPKTISIAVVRSLRLEVGK